MKAVKGFTLIEVMVTVVIIAILASIAYPTYQGSVRKTRRADAQTVMLQVAQWMERFYTVNHRYDKTYSLDDTGTRVSLPKDLRCAPRGCDPDVESSMYYEIRLVSEVMTTFSIEAEPKATARQNKDPCNTLVLDHTGRKGVKQGSTIYWIDASNASDREKAKACW